MMTIIMLTGCQPRVLTDIMMTYPEKSINDVVVYEPGDSIPADAMVLGYVAVVDRGTTTHCKYDVVKSLAVQESAKNGGNGLQIVEHLKPSLRAGSCHQIVGNILLSGRIDPDSLVFITGNDYLAHLDERLKAEEELYAKYEKKMLSLPPKNRLRANFGLGLDPDRVKTYDGNYHPELGSSMLISFEHVLQNNIYCGFTFIRTNATCQQLGEYDIFYIGPTVELAETFDKKHNWLYDVSIGMGLARYSIENLDKKAGFGMHFTVGVDYMLNRHLGVGAETGFVLGSFKKPENVIPNSEDDGFGRGILMLSGGLRYYF